MRMIINLIKKDFLNSMHDQIMIMMIVMPIIMAIILKLLIPSVENPEIKIYIGPGISNEMETELNKYYIVERTDELNKLKNLVNEYGDNPGLYYDQGNYKVILQGDEPEGYKESILSVLKYIGNEKTVSINVKSMEKSKSVIGEILGSAGMLLISGIAGMIMGMSIVEDKESKVNEAISVSPVNVNIYLLSKIIYLFFYSLIFSLICWIILFGNNFTFNSFILTFSCSLLLSMFLAFFIGGVADNQNKAIAIAKISMFVFLFIPVISLIIPEQASWVFYPFPAYWVLKVIMNTILNITKDFALIFSVAIIYNLAVLILLIPFIKKGLRLRMR